MITQNSNELNTTVDLSGTIVSIPSENTDVQDLIKIYKDSPSDENMAKVMDKIDELESVNTTELLVDGLVKYYTKKDLFYFSDDVHDQYELIADTVYGLEDILERGGNILPIINFLKLLRRNSKYSPEFAEECLYVLTSTISNKKLYNKFIDKGYYREVAYMQSNTNLFTLTESGLVVAYKKANFKRHKYDAKTGEMIPRFPRVFDEETGDPIYTYPETAEEYKIYLDSKTIGNLETRDETNKHITVGSVIDQRKGKPGFEKDEISLIFKGTKVSDESEIYAQVLIHPMYINKVSDKFNSISTPVYYFTKFSFRKSLTDIDPSVFIKYANSDWKAQVALAKQNAEAEAQKSLLKIDFHQTL